MGEQPLKCLSGRERRPWVAFDLYIWSLLGGKRDWSSRQPAPGAGDEGGDACWVTRGYSKD